MTLILLSASCSISLSTTVADGYAEGPITQIEAFQIEELGLFRTANYLGENYFAAYDEGLLYGASKEKSLIENRQLSSVLFNSIEEQTFTTGTPLELQEGYELAIQSVDFDGNKAYVELRKDGIGVDSAIISPVPATDAKEMRRSTEDETYAYSVKMGDKTIEIISVHFKNAFRGPDQDVATVDRVWQVSEDSPSSVIYDSNEEMVFASGTPLKLKEDYELAIQAIDLDGTKIYVQLLKSGSVVDSDVVETTSTPEGGENYTYSTNKVSEEDTISIRFKIIFRSADQDLVVVDRVRQASEEQPSEVLIDDDEERTFTTGVPLKLEEGYELKVAATDLDGDKAYVELYKDGVQVDSAVITPPKTLGSETYTYSVVTTGAEGSEIIRVHFKNAFRGPMQDVATVDRIWQASEDRPYHVIRESSDGTIITHLEPLVLDEGYELAIQAIDLDGNKIYVQLMKSGSVVDSAVLTPPDTASGDGTYNYTARANDAEGGEQISVHFKNAFRGAEQDLATIDRIMQMSEDQSSHVIYESVDETIVTSGAPVKLKEGYELVIEEINLNGDKLYVELYKDGQMLHSAVVVPPRATIKDKTYSYDADVGKTADIVIIAVHFKNVFRGAEQDLATVDGIWQISETPIEIGIYPEDAAAWFSKGYALDEQGKYVEAIKAYDEATNLDPDYAAAWFSKGYALIERGNYTEAIQVYDEFIRLDPKDAAGWNNKGAALAGLGKYDEAIQVYDEAIRLDTEFALAWNNKGYALYNQGKYDEAIQAYDEAIRLDPKYADYRKAKSANLVLDLMYGTQSVREDAAETLGDIGGLGAVDALIEALKDDYWGVRAEAATSLGKIRDVRVVDPLIVALKDEDEDVRYRAAIALGNIGDAKAGNDLARALNDEDRWVRFGAARSLGWIGDARGFDPLVKILKNDGGGWDNNLWVRESAAIALGMLGDPRAVTPLIEALKDEDEGVRRDAAYALGLIGDTRAVEPLRYLVRSDRDEDVREAAVEALEKIQAE
ncbi:MAG: S-layer protein domain-containing protein [Methanothrix sp.]|nr:S-layer protein domain-containing protein [Methanothrix sp.]